MPTVTSANATKISAALGRMIAELQNPSPLYRSIGETLVESTKQRFGTGKGPDGAPWAKNSAVTLERYLGVHSGAYTKKGALSKRGRQLEGNKKPLIGETRALSQTITYLVNQTGLQVGSPLEYAAMQQFGGTQAQVPWLWGDIPARPFLGVSDDDADAILAEVAEFFEAILP